MGLLSGGIGLVSQTLGIWRDQHSSTVGVSAIRIRAFDQPNRDRPAVRFLPAAVIRGQG